MDQNIPQNQLGQSRNFFRRHVTEIDITASVIIVLLVMLSVFLWLRYDQLRGEFLRFETSVEESRLDTQTLAFTQMFIDKVLKAQGEIDFETRLNLESAVRALHDEQILASWQGFTGAKTEQEAQNAVKNLLGILVSKIRVK